MSKNLYIKKLITVNTTKNILIKKILTEKLI